MKVFLMNSLPAVRKFRNRLGAFEEEKKVNLQEVLLQKLTNMTDQEKEDVNN